MTVVGALLAALLCTVLSICMAECLSQLAAALALHQLKAAALHRQLALQHCSAGYVILCGTTLNINTMAVPRAQHLADLASS